MAVLKLSALDCLMGSIKCEERKINLAGSEKK